MGSGATVRFDRFAAEVRTMELGLPKATLAEVVDDANLSIFFSDAMGCGAATIAVHLFRIDCSFGASQSSVDAFPQNAAGKDCVRARFCPVRVG